MPTRLIELKDGLLVEIEVAPEEGPKPIAAGAAEQVDGAMDAAQGLLLKAVQPVARPASRLFSLCRCPSNQRPDSAAIPMTFTIPTMGSKKTGGITTATA